MKKLFKRLFYLLDNNSKKKLFFAQILMVISAIFEMLGVFSVAPLIQLISDPNILNDNENLITKVYQYLNVDNYSNFLRIVSIVILFIFIINFAISTYTIYFISKFSLEIGNYLKLRLFKVFSLKPWIFHSQMETSEYVNKIITETNRIATSGILPILNTNAKFLIGIAISGFIFIYNPKISAICFLIFLFSYFLIFKVIKKKIDRNGFIISRTSAEMYNKILETFGGIKETLLHKKQKKFHDDLNLIAKKNVENNVSVQFFLNTPKNFLELIAFSIIILGIIYASSIENEVYLSDSLPVLAVYIFAGYKLLPVFQQIYYGVISIRSAGEAINSVYLDLVGIEDVKFCNEDTLATFNDLKLNEKIEFKNVNFFYLENSKPIIKNLSINIPANSFVSIVGPSGAGKSTLLDILLGLLKPHSGEILLDKKPINSILDNYQQNISYVGQNIFLQNLSIKSNICFGIDQNEINEKKLNNAIEASNLYELIKELPDGIETIVGERGVKISGGQRQRVAIARALYLDRRIIIFDEATSSLDGIIENNIINNLKLFAKNYGKTIIMVTHNINLTRNSDIIHLIDNGSLIESGSFEQLLNNKKFKDLLNEK